MLAVRNYGIQNIRTEEVEKPQIRPTEVLVRILYAGICGSDLHIYNKGMFVTYLPETMGHEFVGVIDAKGESVTDFEIGQLVVGDPRVTCGNCDFCKAELYNLCPQLGFIGEVKPGCFAEYIAMEPKKLIAVPQTHDIRQIALTEPLAVAIHIAKIGKFTAEDKLAVIGAGPIGLLTILVAKKVFKVKHITAIDLSGERLTMAKQAGADSIIKDLSLVPINEYSVVVEAAGAPATLRGALKVLMPGGTLLMAGLYETTVELDPNDIVCKEIKLAGINTYTTSELQEAAKYIATGVIDINFLISQEYSLYSAEEAFRALTSENKSVAKVLLRI